VIYELSIQYKQVSLHKQKEMMNLNNHNRNKKLMWFISVALIIFVLLAFGIVAFVQPERLPRYAKPFVIIHILSAMGWLFLFSYQTKLVINGQIARHEKNAKLGLALVFVITLSSILITYQWGLAERLIGESRDVVIFAILFLLSIWAIRKKKSQTHKRLMLIAALNLIGPAVTRLKFIFDLTDQIAVSITILIWILVPITYDLLTIRKIHKATIFGILLP
jgi:hypothetical protein